MALHDRPDSPTTRRRLLRAAVAVPATAALSATAGCLTRLGLAKTGSLQLLAVSVTWQHDGRHYRDEVYRAHSDGRSEVTVHVDETYADDFGDPIAPQTPDGVYEDLDRRFDEVVSLAGFCWRDGDEQSCRNARVDRAAFDSLSFGDRAEIRPRERDIQVLDVYTGAQGDPATWDVTVNEFDFTELHADDGVPPA